MFKRISKYSRQERGFTLIEIVATVLILSVVGLAVLDVTGKGNLLLARQSNELDSRTSARAVLTRMVKDIETARATTVPDDKTIEIWDQDASGNWVLKSTYGFDDNKRQVYQTDSAGNTQYLINAISCVIYKPQNTQADAENFVNMDITVSVGSSQMTFSATATSRPVDANSSLIPKIWYAGNGAITFPTSGGASTRVLVNGTDTHFNTNTAMVLVGPNEANFNPQNFTMPSSSGRVSGHDVIVYKNGNGNGINSNIVVPTSDRELSFAMQQNDLTQNTTYDLYAFTPNILPGSNSEIAYQLGSIRVVWSDSPKQPPDTTPSKPNPGSNSWVDGDWDLDRGNGGFGSNLLNKQITKMANGNAKIAYYTHPVTCFDYEVTISGLSSKKAGTAQLALFYDGAKNGGGHANFIGFGMDYNNLYFGPDGALQPIPLPTGVVLNGQATLRAVVGYDSGSGKYILNLYVNGHQITLPDTISFNVPVDPATGLIKSTYLGVSADKQVSATFTIVNH